ncbi:hypothetical protein Fot_42849 [Forsythia ovata]|uniref:Uncharacterized protein n=1 Tax=Forsythia ovata TaxID=205694 RepID=A0ABD1RMB9_9LAMI
MREINCFRISSHCIEVLGHGGGANMWFQATICSTQEGSLEIHAKDLLFSFMQTAVSDSDEVWTSYTKHNDDDCVRLKAVEKLKVMRVFSHKLDVNIEHLKTPRCHCCDISSFDETMVIRIRQCGVDELIAMRS